jgi:cytoskeleton protein RodZ
MSDAALSPESAMTTVPPGALLAAARESRGLSVADIAQQLKLSPWQVAALESGDNGRLPGAVFVRGFIRNYARLVKLDAAPLLAHAEYDLPHKGLAVPEMPPSANIPFPTARVFNWHKYAIAAIVVLIPLVVFEFYRDEAPVVTVKSRQVELPAPQVVAENSPADAVEPAVVPPPVNDAPPAVSQQKPELRTVDAPPAVSVKAARGEQVVRLRFARESWVEIRDRNGRKIFSQLNAPGTEQVVSGLPPLSLIVGNANGVQLTHNEQPVNLGPHTKVDVARLTLE